MAKGTYRDPVKGPCPSCGGARGRMVKRSGPKGENVEEWVPCNGCGGSGTVYG